MAKRRSQKAQRGARQTVADPWRRRMDGMISSDRKVAEAILSKYGFTADQARSAVRRASTFSAVIDFVPNAPKEFRDPTNPCAYALQILLLNEHAQAAHPQSLQIGRLWGRASIGLKFPEIAVAMQQSWISSRRGPGGARANDLTRSLMHVLRIMPKAKRTHVLDYLVSDNAKDEFSSTESPKVHVTGVTVDEHHKSITYEDRSRAVHTINFESLEKKIRDLRRKK